MTKFLCIILSAVVLTCTWIDLAIYGLYELNRTYIASSLCMNRAKPQLHCNGSCYLAKQVKQANDAQANYHIPALHEIEGIVINVSETATLTFQRRGSAWLSNRVFFFTESLHVEEILCPPELAVYPLIV